MVTTRSDYVLAALASAVMEHRSELQRPMTLDEFMGWIRSSPLRELVSDVDVAKFADYAVTNKAADLVQTEFARPRILFNAEAFNVLGANAAANSPLHIVRRLGLNWAVESLGNISVIRGGAASSNASSASIAVGQGWSQVPVEEPGANPSTIVLRPVPESPNRTPASDRYVRLDHNAQAYKHAIVTLDEAIKHLQGINEELDEDTAAKIVEISAGRRLLEGTQVNFEYVEKLVLKGLGHLATKVFNAAVDAAIKTALAAVRALFGLP